MLAGGARPNFVKIAPLYRSFRNSGAILPILVHTGQHYDHKMSGQFFLDLGIPNPNYFLNTDTASSNTLTATILTGFEKIIRSEKPDMVVVTGDVTSTFACALTAVNEHVPVAHVEAGLRSFDKSMPEEINRILTDQIAALHFVSEPVAMHNLINENIPLEKVYFTGNVMIDSLVYFQKHNATKRLGSPIVSKPFILLTIHRPSNVDSKASLLKIVTLVKQIATLQNVVFTVHPRTRNRLVEFGFMEELENIPAVVLKEPQGYNAFIRLMQQATAVVTDSGGVQEETTYLQIPCLTFRETTERGITVTQGTNYLISDLSIQTLMVKLRHILNGKMKQSSVPSLWDGKTADRITDLILEYFGVNTT